MAIEPPDPFEITQQDPTPRDSFALPSPSLPSVYSGPSRWSTLAGAAVQVTAIVHIGMAWSAGRVPIAWHALLAIVVAALPPDVVLQLGKWTIKLVARLRSGKP